MRLLRFLKSLICDLAYKCLVFLILFLIMGAFFIGFMIVFCAIPFLLTKFNMPIFAVVVTIVEFIILIGYDKHKDIINYFKTTWDKSSK